MGKYRNFLFSVVFLGIYFAGGLIGILLFRTGFEEHTEWLTAYGASLLEEPLCQWGFWFAMVRPLLFLWLLSFLPWGDRVILVMLGIRGMLNSYFCCSSYAAGIFPAACFLNLISFSFYFLLCRWIFLGSRKS